MPNSITDRIELHDDDRVMETPQTRHRDYILSDYQPRVDPAGRLHSSTALFSILRAIGWRESIYPILARYRAMLGEDETVWGLKTDVNGNLGLELYFYNFDRNSPSNKKQVTTLRDEVRDIVDIKAEVDEALSYFMCSVDLHPRMIEENFRPLFHVYMHGERLRDGYDGISYRVEQKDMILENYYTFYLANEKRNEVWDRVQASIRSGDQESQEKLFPHQLARCHTICYATKPRHDALYFARISTQTLAQSIRKYFSSRVADYFTEYQDLFAHLNWDVGYDFRLELGQREAKIEKFGFYGIL